MAAPEWLDPVAKEVYQKTLTDFPHLENDDPTLLEAYAQVTSLCQQMSLILQEQGLTHINARGYTAANCVLNAHKGYLKSRQEFYAKIRKRYPDVERKPDGFA